MKFAVAIFVITLSSLTIFGQSQSAPTLRIVTETPGLPSELFYGATKIKPLRLRPGTNVPITINDTDFFVSQNYVDFLSRFPDQPGFDFWKGQIDFCGGNAACIDVARTNTSGAFFLSIEFTNTGFYVYRLHKTSFGTLPRYENFMPNSRTVGNGVIVLQGNWEQVLEQNKVNFANSWVTTPEFTAAYPLSMSNQEYVDKLIQTAGVTSGDVNGSALVSGLNGGTETRATVLRKISESSALTNKERNPAFVLMQYFGYLRRNPDAAPDNNLDGYNFWLNKLNQHGGDFHAAEMVRAFIISAEYLNRF